jgi:hypothetical protein
VAGGDGVGGAGAVFESGVVFLFDRKKTDWSVCFRETIQGEKRTFFSKKIDFGSDGDRGSTG